jgi:hypothetical protein
MLIELSARHDGWPHKLLQQCRPVGLGSTDGRKGQGAEQSHNPILHQADQAVATDVADHLPDLLLLLLHLRFDLLDQSIANLLDRFLQATAAVGRGARDAADRVEQMLRIGGGIDGL